jgi:hypothetical protein
VFACPLHPSTTPWRRGLSSAGAAQRTSWKKCATLRGSCKQPKGTDTKSENTAQARPATQHSPRLEVPRPRSHLRNAISHDLLLIWAKCVHYFPERDGRARGHCVWPCNSIWPSAPCLLTQLLRVAAHNATTGKAVSRKRRTLVQQRCRGHETMVTMCGLAVTPLPFLGSTRTSRHLLNPLYVVMRTTSSPCLSRFLRWHGSFIVMGIHRGGSASIHGKSSTL